MDDRPDILIVEDEDNVAMTLRERLERERFVVCWARTVEDAKAVINMQPFDLALLDIGLPDGDGIEVAGLLKKKQPACGVIFLTAFGSFDHRIRGLETGADDYVVKPFHVKELILRIQNALRRRKFALAPQAAHLDEITLGKAVVRFSKFQIQTADGEIHSLTHKECALLKFLFNSRGRAVSRMEILDFVWADEEFPTTRTIDNFIVRFRRLIEADPETPKIIKSVRGVGYRLDVDERGEHE